VISVPHVSPQKLKPVCSSWFYHTVEL